jgi:nucleotide-binding universal stress UspA family protein
MGTIVIGLDGSPGAGRALTWTIAMAKRLGCDVCAVLAVRPFGEFIITAPPFPTETIRLVKDAFEQEWSAPLRESGISYRTELVEADPARALIDVADKADAELIVVGAQGHGRLSDRVLGSVSYRLAHHASRPVVIVPAQA